MNTRTNQTNKLILLIVLISLSILFYLPHYFVKPPIETPKIQEEIWKTYHANHFIIQLPTYYEVKKKKLFNVPYEEVISETNDFALRVEAIDYSHLDKNAMQNLLMDIGVDSLSESLKFSSRDFIRNIFMTDKKAKNIKILLDKPIDNKSIPGRLLRFKFHLKDQTIYSKSAIYLDQSNKQYYVIQGFYYDNKNGELIDQSFDSFTTLTHAVP